MTLSAVLRNGECLRHKAVKVAVQLRPASHLYVDRKIIRMFRPDLLHTRRARYLRKEAETGSMTRFRIPYLPESPHVAAKSSSLVFRAGPGAYAEVRKHGFSPELIGTLAGASGGAKWLVLSQLDRVVLKTIVPNLKGPVHLIGSSIGAWRFACYAQRNPLSAIQRFEEAYLEQTYTAKPSRHEITAKSREILGRVIGDDGVADILSHPVFRTHVMTVRSRLATSSEHPLLLGAGLFAAATANFASRRLLGAFFERALFFDERELPPFYAPKGFPLKRIPISAANLEDAIVATGSIPLVLSGVRDIAGAPPGVYRDGGVIDYHLDLPQSEPQRLSLYLHFIDRIVPGWFDKRLHWRRPESSNVDRTVLISPSPEFVVRLPNRKIPDRKDFVNYSSDERIQAWRGVVAACTELADELFEVLERDLLAERLEPLVP